MKMKTYEQVRPVFDPFDLVITFESQEDVEEWKGLVRVFDFVHYEEMDTDLQMSFLINKMTVEIKKVMEGRR